MMLKKGLSIYCFEFLRKHWAIILVFILGLTPLLWFKPGFIIANGDLFPFVAPSLNFPRAVYVWLDVGSLGAVPQAGGFSPSQTIWMSIWYILSKIRVPFDMSQIFLEVFYFLGAGLSTYFLASTIYKKEKITPFIASIFYMFNFIMFFSIFSAGAAWVLVFLPLMLALYVRIIDNVKNGKKNLRNIIAFAITSSVLMSFATVNPAFIALILMIFVVMFSYSIISQKFIRVKVGKTLGILLVMCGFFNIWWIMPFSTEIIAYVYGSLKLGITTNVISLLFVYSRSSFLNLFWLNGIW